jgi:hypothetical protein
MSKIFVMFCLIGLYSGFAKANSYELQLGSCFELECGTSRRCSR